jgi:Flp pilus assembly protein TadD
VTGDQQKAEAAFKRVLELDPANIQAYNRLGALYMTQHRLDDAKKDYENVAGGQTKSVEAATMVGIILELQNKPAEARQQYERALAIDPQAAVAANNLAWAYADGGEQLDTALQLAQTAKAQLPDRHEVDDTLGWVYYKKQLPTLAIAEFKRTVQAQPDNPVYQYHLGLAYAQNGEKYEARQSLQRALKLKSDFDGADNARKVLASVAG